MRLVREGAYDEPYLISKYYKLNRHLKRQAIGIAGHLENNRADINMLVIFVLYMFIICLLRGIPKLQTIFISKIGKTFVG